MSDCRHGGKDVPSATDAVRVFAERYEKRIAELEKLAEDMDYCIRNSMSCDMCEIRPCRIGERFKELGIEARR